MSLFTSDSVSDRVFVQLAYIRKKHYDDDQSCTWHKYIECETFCQHLNIEFVSPRAEKLDTFYISLGEKFSDPYVLAE